MVIKEFKCQRCGHRFELEVFEEGEADEKQWTSRPVTCEKCRSPSIEAVRIVGRKSSHSR
jgi:DNA-directed RNA polymerase subunit RPC12/RpoP